MRVRSNKAKTKQQPVKTTVGGTRSARATDERSGVFLRCSTPPVEERIEVLPVGHHLDLVECDRRRIDRTTNSNTWR